MTTAGIAAQSLTTIAQTAHRRKRGRSIGSGPAGLCAAAQLNQGRPYRDRFRARGSTRRTVHLQHPDMKLDKELVVLRRINQSAPKASVFSETEVGPPTKQLSRLTKLMRGSFDAVIALHRRHKAA